MTKVEDRRLALERWWNRGPWPCVILAVDTGQISGVTVAASTPEDGQAVLMCKAIDVYEPGGIEDCILTAVAEARTWKLPVAVMFEDWGRGGLTMDAFVGMGEKRGMWRRAIILEAHRRKREDRAGWDTLNASRILHVAQATWRSRVIPESGVRNAEGVWRKFNPDEWKVQAKKTAETHFPETLIPPLDAAESACMAVFAARSDGVLRVLPKKVLDAHAVHDRYPLEPLITGKKRGRKA